MLRLWAHQGEQNDVANGARAGQHHGQAIDADAFTTRGRQAKAERAHKIFIHGMGFGVAAFAFIQLLQESITLLDRVIQFAEGIANFKAADEELEAPTVPFP